jgi:hypothetical protein
MTWRAFVLGLVCAGFLAAAVPWNDFAKGNTFLTGSHFPAGVVALLLLLALGVNVAVKLVRRAWALRQAELMLVWCMMIAACTVPASGLMRFWFPLCAAPAYYASRADLAWEDTILKDAPDDLVLTKDMRSQAAKAFYEGTPAGEPVRIPWRVWARPMTAWGILALTFFFGTFCLCGIFRRQWMESERLLFPLARVPLEFTEDAGAPALLPGFVRSTPLLLGAVSSVVFSLVRVAPVLTGADQGWTPNVPLSQILSGTPLGQTGIWASNIYPIGIAFAFLVPADVSLSIWFFFLFTRAEMQVSHWMGRPIGWGGASGNFMAWQEAGAYAVFALLMLWSARRSLAEVARKAFGRAPGVDDSEEPIGHRLAFWGFAGSFMAMVLWFARYRMSLGVAAVFVALSFVLVLGVARLVAQGGVFFVLQEWKPVDIIHGVSGGRALSGAAAVTGQMHNNVFFWDVRELLSAHVMNALRIAPVFGRRRRLLLPAMGAAIVLAMPVAGYSSLRMYYDVGAYNVATAWGTRNHPINTFNKADRMIATPSQSAEPKYGALAAGGGVMLFLTIARTRFYWWPVHWLGFMMGSSYAAHMLWLSVMLGWLTKVLTMRFCGGRALALVRRFFMGVILAESLGIAASTVLGLCGTHLGAIFLPN